MRSVNPLLRFVLRVAAWLPPTFALWYLAAPLLVWPLALLCELVTRSAFADLVKSVEQSGYLITFVTSLKPAQATTSTVATAVLSVEVNALVYAFGLPMLAALILAAGQPHRLRHLVLGYLVLLPFETWGVVAQLLKEITLVAGPAVASQTGFSATQRETIAFAFQFGSLILPTVAPAVVWVLMHRRFLERFANRGAP